MPNTLKRITPALALCAVLLAGCATPATRIRQHPDVYAQATLQQQALISQGRIALGFTPGFVRLALGAPDRITERTDRRGTQTVWHYFADDGGTTVVYGGLGYGGFYGGPFAPWPPVVVERGGPPRDRLRVTFESGHVTAIERQIND